MQRTTAALATILLLTTGTASAAEGWPRWLGPEGNGISTETGLANQWPEGGPKQLWSAKVGIGFSSPIALDGKIYMFAQDGSDDVLYAFEADSGKVLWTQKYERGEDPPFPGTRATPTIDGTRIYTHGSAGDLVCRELSDGKQVWRTNILKETNAKKIEWGSASSPLVTDKHVFVQGGQDGDATAVAVDKTSGAIVWKSQAKGMAGYATPILIQVDPQNKQQQLVIFGGDAVYGVDPANGKTLWTEPWKTDNDINAATPVFSGSHLLVSSSRNFGAMLINVTPQGAKKEWEKKDVALKFQPPILDGTTLYANSGGTLKAINWPDFKVLWTATGRDLNLGGGGSLVRVGDKLITLSERGKLSLIQATPAAFKLISQAQVFDYSQVWSSPLVYRGKLYVKGEDQLLCLDISGPKP